MNKRFRYIYIFTLLLFTTACDSIDCPINNVVYATYGFYAIVDGESTSISIVDTLTITASGTDSVLLNRTVKASKAELPMSYVNETDTLIFTVVDTLSYTKRDTIWISKQNIQHFESPECPAAMFHNVTGASWTSVMIDSVTIVKPEIDYNVSENFKIYFHYSD